MTCDLCNDPRASYRVNAGNLSRIIRPIDEVWPGGEPALGVKVAGLICCAACKRGVEALVSRPQG